jgi:transposase-like protein
MEALTLQRRPRASPEERAQWLAKYHSSQLSARQFAQEHGLNDGTLQRWIREEGQHNKSKSKAPAFQQVHLSPLMTADWAAEVVLPGGIAVRLAATASATWMRSLWESLRS